MKRILQNITHPESPDPSKEIQRISNQLIQNINIKIWNAIPQEFLQDVCAI
jgi:hypothetical protein